MSGIRTLNHYFAAMDKGELSIRRHGSFEGEGTQNPTCVRSGQLGERERLQLQEESETRFWRTSSFSTSRVTRLSHVMLLPGAAILLHRDDQAQENLRE